MFIIYSLGKMITAVEQEKRNIEIKARLADDAAYEKRIEIAKHLTNTDGIMLNQRDVFYNVNTGRLKLRMEVCYIWKNDFFKLLASIYFYIFTEW